MIKNKFTTTMCIGMGIMLSTTAINCNSPYVKAAVEETSKQEESISEAPSLIISEVMPDSSNMNKADAYEFFEVYNNSDIKINLKDYRIYYSYPDSGKNSDVLWKNFNEDVYLESGSCVVFWIKNGKNNELTTEDFNKKFGTSLELNKNLFEIYSGGMANGSARGLRLTTNVGDEIDYVTYNMNGNKDVVTDKSIKYSYDKSNKAFMINNASNPTPGKVEDSEKPVIHKVSVSTKKPVITDLTKTTFNNNEGLKFEINASAYDTSLKTVKLYYKDNSMNNYEMYYLPKSNGDNYSKDINTIDLLGKEYFDYYFEVSDGFNSTATNVKRINSTSISKDKVRLNVSEGQYLNGNKNSIITTGDTLFLDDLNVTDKTTSSIESKAKIVFDASQTDTFFKNAVAIKDDVLGIFNEGTYDTWATVSYDVDPAYFTKGDSIQIDIHAGNKANPLEHNEENNDDFVVKNIRLVLPNGKTIRAMGYEDPEKVISMGDSAGKVEILNAKFTVDDDSYNALRYDFDSREISDGQHVISSSYGNENKKVNLNIDNTAPDININVENLKSYKSTYEIAGTAKDNVSGLKSFKSKIDDKEVTLPCKINSLNLVPGKHKLTLTAEDNCGNINSKEIEFQVSKEDADILEDSSLKNGEVISKDPTFSLIPTDPTGDNMKVQFKRGESYTLKDNNIIRSSGVSNTSGSSENVFKSNSNNGFPYEVFEIKVTDKVNEKADIKVNWAGSSNNKKTNMYVFNYLTNKFEKVETVLSEDNGKLNLTGTVSLTNHLSNNKVKVMVQNGEGYTPTQYESEAKSVTKGNENDLARNKYDFTFAVESDTQYYNEESSDNPTAIGKYKYQLDIHNWLLNNRERMNIQYLFHDGDIIDDENITGEWVNADNAYKLLDNSQLPYGILAGNHDVGHLEGDYSNYNKYFGENRYKNNPWYGESYKDNRGHYDLITVDGIDFIMLYMGWGIGDDEIKWMNDVLKKYPERKAILNFHEYLLASGGLGEEPQRVQDEVIAKNSNVCMVLSGHYHNSKTVVKEFDDNGDGANDRKVYEMLFDYQSLTEGGMGYMRLMHFDMNNKKIIVRTYSPSLDDYDAKDNNNINSEGISGEEEFEIPFSDLGITPEKKVLSTDNLKVNVYTDEVMGTVENVKSNDKVSYTWSDAPNGTYGWYGEVTDEFGGLSRSDVNYFTVAKESTAPKDIVEKDNNNEEDNKNIKGEEKAASKNTTSYNNAQGKGAKTADAAEASPLILLALSLLSLLKSRKKDKC